MGAHGAGARWLNRAWYPGAEQPSSGGVVVGWSFRPLGSKVPLSLSPHTRLRPNGVPRLGHINWPLGSPGRGHWSPSPATSTLVAVPLGLAAAVVVLVVVLGCVGARYPPVVVSLSVSSLRVGVCSVVSVSGGGGGGVGGGWVGFSGWSCAVGGWLRAGARWVVGGGGVRAVISQRYTVSFENSTSGVSVQNVV